MIFVWLPISSKITFQIKWKSGDVLKTQLIFENTKSIGINETQKIIWCILSWKIDFGLLLIFIYNIWYKSGIFRFPYTGVEINTLCYRYFLQAKCVYITHYIKIIPILFPPESNRIKYEKHFAKCDHTF